MNERIRSHFESSGAETPRARMSLFTGVPKTALLVIIISSFAAGAFLGSFAATWVRDASDEARRLADVYGAASTMSAGKGCLAISSATANLDLSTGGCNSMHCPDCFYFTGSADSTLTLSNCQTSKWGSTTRAIGTGGALPSAVRQYTFINTMTGNKATVSDGTNSMEISAKGSAGSKVRNRNIVDILYSYSGLLSAVSKPHFASKS